MLNLNRRSFFAFLPASCLATFAGGRRSVAGDKWSAQCKEGVSSCIVRPEVNDQDARAKIEQNLKPYFDSMEDALGRNLTDDERQNILEGQIMILKDKYDVKDEVM